MLITEKLLSNYDSHQDYLSANPIKEVFLDMDGVVCNWYKAACDLMNVDYDSIDFKNDEYAFDKVVKDEDLSDRVNHGFDLFFLSIPWFEHTKELMDSVKNANGIILTAPMRDCPGTYSGKVRWIHEFWPDSYRFIITEHKDVCARPTSLLIDDKKSNC